MGIKDLAGYIRKNTHCYREKHLSEYYGKKVAVDISVFLYKTIRSQGEDRWMMPMVLLLKCLKKYGIKIVCVFDGPNAPQEKMKEREERKKSANKVRDKVTEIQRLLKLVNTYVESGKDELPRKITLEIREICSKQRNTEKVDEMDYRDINECKRMLEETEKKFLKQCIPITKDHSEQVKELVRHLGMAVMQADGEAETMCAYMCVKGLVDAVLTEDTDVLAYETPLFLSKIDTTAETVKEIQYSDLIAQMEMSAIQFKDFCIMCSCDYNDRIKLPQKKEGKKQTGIGPAKAYALLMKHGSIDNIEYMTDLDVTPLKHQRCRKLFTIPKIYDGLILPYNKPIDLPNVQMFLRKHNCEFLYSQIKETWSPVPLEFVSDDEDDSPLNDEIESPPKKSPPPRRKLLAKNNDTPQPSPKKSPPPRRKLLPKNEDVYEQYKDELYDEISSNDDEDEFYDFEIYSDGSCLHNPGTGGWAACIIDKNKKENVVKGSEDNTTNNRMELTAPIKALKYIYKLHGAQKFKIKIYTDSEYVKNGITMWIKKWKLNGWKTSNKTDVKNVDLWKLLDRINQNHKIKWEWVKAHNGNKYNEKVDKLANQSARDRKKNMYL